MKKSLLILVAVGAIGGLAYAYYALRTTAPKFTVTTGAATQGDLVETVGATGTLQAVTTVQVGSQVSGNIAYLGADFNSLVRKGQVLARLDPSLFEAQAQQARANLAQSRANLVKAQSDLERFRVQLIDAQQKYTRAKELSARHLLPQSDLDTSKTAVDSAQASLQSQQATVSQVQAAITQAEAGVNQNQVNLDHTVITAPIDGLVISRNVDVGQTVAASMQAPTLFVLAADLTKMQVVANLDESDVGRIRPGQPVSFRVDAYPTETFRGSVSQVRLEPKVQQNVVTYATVINVPNDGLKLKPGMTANVNIEVARANNALRVPNSALRFRPTAEMFAAIGQTPPDPATLRAEGGRSGGRGQGSGVPTAASDSAASAPTTRPTTPASPVGPPAVAAGAPTMTAPARRANMTPERLAQKRERRRADAAPAAAQNQGATTIDALFGPLPRTESAGRVWVYADRQLRPIRLRIGISDGQVSEVLDGELQAGQELVTNLATAATATRPAATNAFPFGQPQRGGPPGGFGGGFGGTGSAGGNRGGGR